MHKMSWKVNEKAFGPKSSSSSSYSPELRHALATFILSRQFIYYDDDDCVVHHGRTKKPSLIYINIWCTIYFVIRHQKLELLHPERTISNGNPFLVNRSRSSSRNRSTSRVEPQSTSSQQNHHGDSRLDYWREFHYPSSNQCSAVSNLMKETNSQELNQVQYHQRTRMWIVQSRSSVSVGGVVIFMVYGSLNRIQR